MPDELQASLPALRRLLSAAIAHAAPGEREKLIALRDVVEQACRRIRLDAFRASTAGIADDQARLRAIVGTLAAANSKADTAREAVAVAAELARLVARLVPL